MCLHLGKGIVNWCSASEVAYGIMCLFNNFISFFLELKSVGLQNEGLLFSIVLSVISFPLTSSLCTMVDWISFTGVLAIPVKAKEDPVINLCLGSGKIPTRCCSYC